MAVPEQSKKITVTTPDKLSQNRKESSDQCPECKDTAYQAEVEKKTNLRKIQDTITAHKAHSDFLRLQVDSAAAKANPDLEIVFRKCFEESMKMRAAKTKEFLTEFRAM